VVREFQIAYEVVKLQRQKYGSNYRYAQAKLSFSETGVGIDDGPALLKWSLNDVKQTIAPTIFQS